MGQEGRVKISAILSTHQVDITPPRTLLKLPALKIEVSIQVRAG